MQFMDQITIGVVITTISIKPLGMIWSGVGWLAPNDGYYHY
jgi:hypothetical protein